MRYRLKFRLSIAKCEQIWTLGTDDRFTDDQRPIFERSPVAYFDDMPMALAEVRSVFARGLTPTDITSIFILDNDDQQYDHNGDATGIG